MPTVPNVVLNNGVTIPQLGFGTFKVPPDETAAVVGEALATGYRHLDTAQMYGNETGVGQAVADSRLDRSEVFVTSKLNNGFHSHDAAIAAFDASLQRLGFDYLDLFLIHWPLPARDEYVQAWLALEELYAQGRVRAIGVSNFHQEHLRRVIAEGSVIPAVNQVEVHPYLVQDPLRAFCAELGIVIEAWSPIARGQVLTDPVVRGIAEEVQRSPAQVVLRWAIQRGDIVFPKSMNPDRMRENFELFDFVLSEPQMVAITAMDRGHRTGPNPEEFNFVSR